MTDPAATFRNPTGQKKPHAGIDLYGGAKRSGSRIREIKNLPGSKAPPQERDASRGQPQERDAATEHRRGSSAHAAPEMREEHAAQQSHPQLRQTRIQFRETRRRRAKKTSSCTTRTPAREAALQAARGAMQSRESDLLRLAC